MLFFKVGSRVLARIVYFVFGASFVIPWLIALLCGCIGLIAGAIRGAYLPPHSWKNIMDWSSRIGMSAAIWSFLISFLVTSISFIIAAVLCYKNRDGQESLHKTVDAALTYGLVGAVISLPLAFPVYILAILAISSWSGLTPSLDWSTPLIAGLMFGSSTGIFFGAIYGAQGKQLPTHQILPTLRRWLKLSTHGK